MRPSRGLKKHSITHLSWFAPLFVESWEASSRRNDVLSTQKRRQRRSFREEGDGQSKLTSVKKYMKNVYEKKLHIQGVPQKTFSVKRIAIKHFFLTACSDSTQKVGPLLLFSTSHVNEPFVTNCSFPPLLGLLSSVCWSNIIGFIPQAPDYDWLLGGKTETVLRGFGHLI